MRAVIYFLIPAKLLALIKKSITFKEAIRAFISDKSGQKGIPALQKAKHFPNGKR